MTLHEPVIITSRLMAGLRLEDGAELSIGFGEETLDGRIAYDVWIDLPEAEVPADASREFHVTDMRSGVGRASLQEGLEALLAFLEAAAEAHGYRERTGRPTENEDLFEAPIVAWAAGCADEIGCLRLGLEERPNLIED